MSKTKSSKRIASARRKTAAQSAAANKRSPKKSEAAATLKPGTTRKPSKIDQIIAMLCRPNGASISDLSKATDWQVHSVRGAISGTIRKKQGLNVISKKSGNVRLYHIADQAAG
jgi:Protein of unknown function (DUF3489)